MIEPTQGASGAGPTNFKQFSDQYSQHLEQLIEELKTLLEHCQKGDLEKFFDKNPNFLRQFSSNLQDIQKDNGMIDLYQHLDSSQKKTFKKMEQVINSIGTDKDSIMQALDELMGTKLGHIFSAINDAKKYI